MIDIDFEKSRKLSTQDMYDIVSFAADASYDNGFMNEFIFEHALYVFAAIILYPEDKEELVGIAAKNINDAWDKIISKGVIDKMMEEYAAELNKIADIGRIWFDDYRTYTLSARGLLDVFQNISGNFLQNSLKQIRDVAQEEGVSNILDIADKWGMNNSIEIPEEKLDIPDSVFE